MGDLVVPFAIVGMSCFFSASVRAPAVTGMVLVIEMTASTAVIVPMLAATAAAVLAAHLAGSLPIYDSLRERSLEVLNHAAPTAALGLTCACDHRSGSGRKQWSPWRSGVVFGTATLFVFFQMVLQTFPA